MALSFRTISLQDGFTLNLVALRESALLAPDFTVSQVGHEKGRMGLHGGDVVQKTVLIVEDNASLRRALCALFERQPDIDVCGAAENGHEAIEAAGRLHPDLVVLDLLMPGMNGLDTARELKRVLPTVPVILYSALEESLSEQAKLIGISEIVSKTDHPSLLLEKARALLRTLAA